MGPAYTLSIVEYWRWWVVHLWVEGFFEVFATTVIAFFFTRLGLIRPALAAKAALSRPPSFSPAASSGLVITSIFPARRRLRSPGVRFSARWK